ncbi:thymine dioxygenase [Beauveria brongniartii RCEF 3172]|uniref:Thymine dioxygenase n=1 Tax=Beauveria brongniartii RCEF 3172 TaxID=1081107 RepID=A0A162KEH4_9HYPO|nr:thymine dioxygenase [Beauveria brongniartii RCEF 3172]
MSAEAAVQDQGLVIPLIDFSLFLHGSPAERAATARAVLHGFQTAGFVYLARHAIPPAAESFEIGREPHERFRNHWPAQDKVDGFREEMMAFFETCQELHVQVMRAVAMGLGLDETHFDGFVDSADNTLRLLHYPQVKADVFKDNVGQLRAGEHTDYGSVTLLFQDDRGGLQVRSPSGKFVDATPIPDTIVVNAGDLLARWSNDTIKSTIHRVVEPPHDDHDGHDASVDVDVVYPPRYSVAYFCNPNADKLIEAMPGTYADEADKKYEGITSGDYLFQRLAATY